MTAACGGRSPDLRGSLAIIQGEARYMTPTDASSVKSLELDRDTLQVKPT